MTREVMPVLDAPLYYFAIIKISEQEGGVLLKTHHLISDGWSQVSLINKLAGCYLDLISGREAVLKPAPGYDPVSYTHLDVYKRQCPSGRSRMKTC